MIYIIEFFIFSMCMIALMSPFILLMAGGY